MESKAYQAELFDPRVKHLPGSRQPAPDIPDFISIKKMMRCVTTANNNLHQVVIPADAQMPLIKELGRAIVRTKLALGGKDNLLVAAECPVLTRAQAVEAAIAVLLPQCAQAV